MSNSTVYLDKIYSKDGNTEIVDTVNRSVKAKTIELGGNIIASHSGVEGAGTVTLQNATLDSGLVFPALGNSAVGTVSQSSGTPTGDIIERGSNANGEFVKYADGTMICWEAGKTLFYDSESTFRLSTKTFPISFVSVNPCVSMSGNPSTSSGNFDISNDQRVYYISLSSFNYVTASGAFSSDQTRGFSWVAIGRWY